MGYLCFLLEQEQVQSCGQCSDKDLLYGRCRPLSCTLRRGVLLQMRFNRFVIFRFPILTGALSVLLILLASSVLSGGAKRKIDLRDGEFLQVSLPASSTNPPTVLVEYSFGGGQVKTFRLLHTGIERPLLFMPGAGKEELFCLFEFDVGLRLLVFDAGSDRESRSLGSELAVMVPGSEVPVRLADAPERQYVLESLARMNKERFRELSIATWELGPIRFYAKRQNLIERLHR